MKSAADITNEAQVEAERLFPGDDEVPRLQRICYVGGWCNGYRQHDVDQLRAMLDAGNKALAGAGVA